MRRVSENDTKMETENGRENYRQAGQRGFEEIKRKGWRLKKDGLEDEFESR